MEPLASVAPSIDCVRRKLCTTRRINVSGGDGVMGVHWCRTSLRHPFRVNGDYWKCRWKYRVIIIRVCIASYCTASWGTYVSKSSVHKVWNKSVTVELQLVEMERSECIAANCSIHFTSRNDLGLWSVVEPWSNVNYRWVDCCSMLTIKQRLCRAYIILITTVI